MFKSHTNVEISLIVIDQQMVKIIVFLCDMNKQQRKGSESNAYFWKNMKRKVNLGRG